MVIHPYDHSDDVACRATQLHCVVLTWTDKDEITGLFHPSYSNELE